MASSNVERRGSWTDFDDMALIFAVFFAIALGWMWYAGFGPFHICPVIVP